MNRVFLLSPANASGIRANMVMNERAAFDLAVRLRREGAPLGELFTFMSALYFRGKAVYSRAFAAPPPTVPPALIITAGRGLVRPNEIVGLDDLRAIAGIPVDLAESRYRIPLERDSLRLRESIDPECEVVLLGSIATSKYVEPLLDVFGDRLMFPAQFVGRGDMSRGGLMLRCAEDGTELDYIPVAGAVRRGPRTARLPKLIR